MELLYIWIDDYKIIQKQGFNFNSNWGIEYVEGSNTLNIERRKPLYEDFFGERIINITAVVGENGAGKSTLFEFLLGHYLTPYEYLYHDLIAVWRFERDNEPLILVHYSTHFNPLTFLNTGGININRSIYNPEVDSEEWDIAQRKYHPVRGFNKIFYSNSLDQRHIPFKGFNISSTYLTRGGEGDEIHNSNSALEKSPNLFQAHFIKDLKRQIDFLQETEDLPFTPPDELTVYPTHIVLSNLSSEINGQNVAVIINFFAEKISSFLSPDTHPFIKALLIDFYQSVFGVLLRTHIENAADRDQLNLVTFLDSFFENIPNPIEALINRLDTDRKEFCNTFLNFTRNLPEAPDYFRRLEGFWVIDSPNWEAFYTDILTRFEKVIFDFLIITWNAPSTGEVAFLKLFSRLYALKDRIEALAPPIFLFIDEGETGFHPQWQKKYLKFIFDFLNSTFDNEFQLFISSHSPFLISDLPKENVILLKKDDSSLCYVVNKLDEIKDTFGANINTLLSDGFFLKGLVGDFAKNKIDKVIEFLNDKNTMNSNEVERIIDMVGDPIVKKYLESQYNTIKQKNQVTELEAKIAQLESENQTLRNGQNP